MPNPIYTAQTCPNPAYQLNWSYSLFWHLPPIESHWLKALTTETEQDGIRILQHRFTGSSTSQFLVSTRPGVSPQILVQRLKGRLQHLLKGSMPNAFQRNYSFKTSHAIYWYNLHLVMVHDGRFREIRDDHAQKRLRAIGNIASVKGHLLSRAALLPDHLHLALRCDLAESPEQVALAYLNNLAFVEGMKPVFRFGYYVGTFGEYDLGVIPHE